MRKLLAITLLFSTAYAQATTYVGVDFDYYAMRGRDADNYAMREVLGSHYRGIEAYAAYRFTNDVGVSIGWQQTNTLEQTHTFSANETFLGTPQNAGDSTFTQTQIRAVNIDVNGYVNISEAWEAIGQLGVSMMESNMEGTLYANGVASSLAPSHTYLPVPRVGLALQYFCMRCIGFRVVGHWTGTNMFHQKFTDDDGVRRNIKPFTQCWSVGIGVVGKF